MRSYLSNLLHSGATLFNRSGHEGGLAGFDAATQPPAPQDALDQASSDPVSHIIEEHVITSSSQPTTSDAPALDKAEPISRWPQQQKPDRDSPAALPQSEAAGQPPLIEVFEPASQTPHVSPQEAWRASHSALAETSVSTSKSGPVEPGGEQNGESAQTVTGAQGQQAGTRINEASQLDRSQSSEESLVSVPRDLYGREGFGETEAVVEKSGAQDDEVWHLPQRTSSTSWITELIEINEEPPTGSRSPSQPDAALRAESSGPLIFSVPSGAYEQERPGRSQRDSGMLADEARPSGPIEMANVEREEHILPAHISEPVPRSQALGRLAPHRNDNAPKLTINRLDIQIVNQVTAPDARPSPRAEPQPLQDAWRDMDRHHLGRFYLSL